MTETKPDRPELREKIEEALNEYVGFPADNVPRWVDWDLAIKEILALIPDIEELNESLEYMYEAWEVMTDIYEQEMEEARREERERIIKLLDTKNLTELHKRWQALKGGSNVHKKKDTRKTQER